MRNNVITNFSKHTQPNSRPMAQVFHGLVLCYLRGLPGDNIPGYVRTAGLVLCLNVLLFSES